MEWIGKRIGAASESGYGRHRKRDGGHALHRRELNYACHRLTP